MKKVDARYKTTFQQKMLERGERIRAEWNALIADGSSRTTVRAMLAKKYGCSETTIWKYTR